MENSSNVIKMDDAIADQAALWFKRMSDTVPPTPTTRATFEAWLNADTRHKEAYNDYMAIWENSAFTAALEDLAHEANGETEESLFAAPAKEPQARHFPVWPALSALAASLLIAVSTWLYVGGWPSPAEITHHATKVGEQKTIQLADGTAITLNTDTRLQVAYDRSTRQVFISQGEAYFEVAKEERPFHIEGGTGKISVLGTSFDVRIGHNQMTVSVDSGRVAVSPLHATDQRLEVGVREKIAVTDKRLGTIQQAPTDVADWRDGWLEFNDESLATVAEELDRYYDGDIRLSGEALWRLRVTGRFNLTDVERATSILAKSLKLNISKSKAGELVLG